VSDVRADRRVSKRGAPTEARGDPLRAPDGVIANLRARARRARESGIARSHSKIDVRRNAR
jgi:hypothetical protein